MQTVSEGLDTPEDPYTPENLAAADDRVAADSLKEWVDVAVKDNKYRTALNELKHKHELDALPWGTEVGAAFKKSRFCISWQLKFLLLLEWGLPRPGHPILGYKKENEEGNTTLIGLIGLHITLFRSNGLWMPWAADAATVVSNPIGLYFSV